MLIEPFGKVEMERLARHLVDARLQARMTQTDVAGAAQLNLAHYNEIENGKRPGIRVDTLYRLCQVLRVDANTLLGLTLSVNGKGKARDSVPSSHTPVAAANDKA